MSLRQRFQPAAPQAPAPDREARAANALAAKRGRASAAAAPKAGKSVAALLRPLMPQGGMGLNELKRRWADIVGPPFAASTSPEKLAAGTLTLRAPSALAPFLTQQAPLLIDRLRLAGAQVKTIRVEQRSAPMKPKGNVRALKKALTPAEEAALAQSLDHVGDDAVKSALLRLGRAVKQS